MQKQRSLLILILVLAISAITVLVQIPIRLGLDLQGGAQLTIQVKPSEDGAMRYLAKSWKEWM